MNKTSHDSEVPKEGQQVITACAFIHRLENGRHQVFLPRRATTKKFLPGVFELPGGHIDFGEDLVLGLKREIFEEFEIDIRVGSPFSAFTYLNEIKGSHSLEIIYFAKLEDERADIKLHPEDHSDYRWLSEDQLNEAFTADKSEDDPEFKVIREGFRLLNNGGLNFG